MYLCWDVEFVVVSDMIPPVGAIWYGIVLVFPVRLFDEGIVPYEGVKVIF